MLSGGTLPKSVTTVAGVAMCSLGHLPIGGHCAENVLDVVSLVWLGPQQSIAELKLMKVEICVVIETTGGEK